MLLLKTRVSAKTSFPQPVLLHVGLEHSRLGSGPLAMGVLNICIWIMLLKPAQREIKVETGDLFH